MTPPEPLILQRITTTYSAGEDRLCLAGETPGHAPRVVWLTRRLMQRLIPHLLDIVAQGDPDPRRVEIMQGFAQQQARATHAPEPPVEAGRTPRAWRASDIDIERSAEGVTLTMRGSELPVRLALNPLQLRQWLNILYDNYRMAGWPLDIWPDWVQESARPQTAPQEALWH